MSPLNLGSPRAVAVDAHVCLRAGVPGRELLAAWASNFAKYTRASQRVGVLMLAESDGGRVFDDLRAAADGVRIKATDEPVSLGLKAGEWTLVAIAGRRIVTREGLDVLGLATGAAPRDGQSLEATIDAIRADDGLPVLSWGVGKWLGPRGEHVARAMRRYKPGEIFFGDIGGRPRLWRSVHLARAAAAGFRILPGTAALPIAGQAEQIGRYGLTLPEPLPLDRPAERLKRSLRDPSVVTLPYGVSSGLAEFAMHQVVLGVNRLSAIRPAMHATTA